MEQVRIRELRKEDSHKYFEWINKRELVILNSAYSPISELSHNNWFESVTKNNQIQIFSIVVENDSDDELLIGSCSLRNIDNLNQNAELQIRIGEENFQNRGFGTKVTLMLVEFGFRDLNLNRIYLDVFQNNKRALKTYTKCGFVEEGVKRESVFIDGEFINVVQMSILSKEFFK